MTLSTWSEVRQHLEASYGPLPDDDRLEVAVALDSGEPQTLTLHHVDAFGVPWIQVVGVLGQPHHVPIGPTLGTNATSAIGAFCLIDGLLALRQVMLLVDLDPADLDEMMQLVAWQVAQGRRRLGSDKTKVGG